MERTSNEYPICLQPELLDRDTIIQVLTERQLKLKNLNSLSREELIVIYKSYVLPLPQRTKSNAETSHKHDNANDNNHVTKKLKVDHFESNNKESRKRNGHGLSEGDVTNIKRKRQKITWP
ncbi:uncharacterized protein LOC113385442 [Ctenocephalides felis]|uniref:uncharacterized protein LOC113385442 n=1 Tax=Ctenocephalides felis TaxID=7515 RepID=UPI000E6E2DA8|nr:uncharacterized protein LOC113385442 [Ctenocephalides felis]